MNSKWGNRRYQCVLGCVVVLCYLSLTFAGSFHWHHSPQEHCCASCPAGHGDSSHSVSVGHDDNRHASMAADAVLDEPCQLCAWAAASRIGARQVVLADEAPAPAGIIRAVDGPRYEPVDFLTAHPRGPPRPSPLVSN